MEWSQQVEGLGAVLDILEDPSKKLLPTRMSRSVIERRDKTHVKRDIYPQDAHLGIELEYLGAFIQKENLYSELVNDHKTT